MHYEIFWHSETKGIWRKIVILSPFSPPLFHNFFDNGNFVKHREAPLRNYSALWDKITWAKSLVIPYSPLTYKKFLRYRIISGTEQRTVTLRSFSVLRDKKIGTKKWYNPRHAKALPYEDFRYCETTKFRKEFLIPPTSCP